MTPHPRPVPASPRARNALPRAALPLGSIVIRDDLRVRASPQLDPRHVQELAATVRRRNRLDDLLVWTEETPEGAPTGRYVLLDGRHRLEAYRIAWRSSEDRSQGAPVSIFTGPRMEARLQALSSNVRRKLGLTKAERMDAAWRMVWDYGAALSKSRLAGAANVSDRTVGNMRARWQEMLATGQEPTFDWRQDKGDPPCGVQDMDQERQASIKAATAELRRLLLRRPRPSTEFLTEVASDLFGTNDLHWIADYILGGDIEDEFMDDKAPVENREGNREGDF